jgi:hypothetical protein
MPRRSFVRIRQKVTRHHEWVGARIVTGRGVVPQTKSRFALLWLVMLFGSWSLSWWPLFSRFSPRNPRQVQVAVGVLLVIVQLIGGTNGMCEGSAIPRCTDLCDLDPTSTAVSVDFFGLLANFTCLPASVQVNTFNSNLMTTNNNSHRVP